jgi:hypothetical protein
MNSLLARLKRLEKARETKKPVYFFWGSVDEEVRRKLEKSGGVVYVVQWLENNVEMDGPI